LISDNTRMSVLPEMVTSGLTLYDLA